MRPKSFSKNLSSLLLNWNITRCFFFHSGNCSGFSFLSCQMWSIILRMETNCLKNISDWKYSVTRLGGFWFITVQLCARSLAILANWSPGTGFSFILSGKKYFLHKTSIAELYKVVKRILSARLSVCHQNGVLWLVGTTSQSLYMYRSQQKTTSMEGDLDGRWPRWKMTSVKDSLAKDDFNGRRPQRKTTSTEDNLNGRLYQWETTSTEENLNGRQPHGRGPQRKTTTSEDKLNGRHLIKRRPQWKKTSREDDFNGRRPQ